MPYLYILFVLLIALPLKAHAIITLTEKNDVCDLMASRMAPRLEITDPEFASGGEGWVAEGLRDGNERVAIKVFFPDKKSPESVRAEVANLNQVLAKGGERAKKFFPPYELVELADDGSLPVLVSRMVEWEPGSKRNAPTLLDCINNGFRELGTTKQQRLAARFKAFRQLAEATTILQDAGIAHRDLNYRNILIEKSGDIKILDWGVSALYGQHPVVSSRAPGLITGHRRFIGPGQGSGDFATPRDDVETLRRMSWYLLAPENYRNKNHVRGLVIDDFAGAPETPATNPAYAIAAWSRMPNTPHEYNDLLKQAESMPVAEFLPFYTRKLLRQEPISENGTAMYAAQGILDSPTLIKNFPDGLGVTATERDAIIKGAIALFNDTHDPESGAPILPLVGAHGYQHYDEFFDRIEQLQIERKLTKRYDLPGRPPNQRRLRFGLPPFRWVPGEDTE
jgi:serine/threonine protein kinase